jgi:hypothetical protein
MAGAPDAGRLAMSAPLYGFVVVCVGVALIVAGNRPVKR